MMRKPIREVLVALAVLAALGTALPAGAVPDVTNAHDNSLINPSNKDDYRTGGCSGCFQTQMVAAIATFSNIKRVFRGCGSNYAAGGAFPSVDDCSDAVSGVDAPDFASGSDLLDFVILQGDLRNSSTAANDGLGVPGGATDVSYRISASGSSNGVLCSRVASPGQIGFLAPEGYDGLPNTADDAGGTGAFAAPGVGRDINNVALAPGLTSSEINDIVAAPLVRCDTDVDTEFPFPNPADFPGGFVTTAASFTSSADTELCVVDYDRDSDGQIDNDRVGVPIANNGVPVAVGTAATLPTNAVRVGAVAGNESHNLRLSCDTSFADLPTADFISASINTQDFSLGDVFGAVIFKFIASKDVHAIGSATTKIQVWDPTVENLFGAPESNSLCTWEAIGAEADVSTVVTPVINAVPTTMHKVSACFRELGSGTRETMRNTFMANVGGSKVIGADPTAGSGTNYTCVQSNENGHLIGPPFPVKTYDQNGGTGDVVDCVQARKGAIGYVDADRQPSGTEFYGVPMEGVDPDTNITDLKLLTSCGMYRFWGPLSGGIGTRPQTNFATPTTANTNAHRLALTKSNVFTAFGAYQPLDGIAFSKTVTDGAYSLQFAPQNCPAVPTAIGTIP
jgi:hypothetical protein